MNLLFRSDVARVFDLFEEPFEFFCLSCDGKRGLNE